MQLKLRSSICEYLEREETRRREKRRKEKRKATLCHAAEGDIARKV